MGNATCKTFCQRCSKPTRAKVPFRRYLVCRACKASLKREFDWYRFDTLRRYLGIVEPRRAA